MITVKEAIAGGHRRVNYPVLAILIGIPVICLFLDKTKLLPAWGMPLSIITAFSISWVYWSFSITKWRLWAFKNVDDIHELKRRAIKEKLIWEDGNIFEKTEIRTKNEQAEWESILKDRFGASGF